MIQNNLRKDANKLVELALELEKEGKENDAIQAYLKAIEKDKNWSIPYYNLGLVYKYRKDWKNALLYNQKSAELAPGDQPSLWNWGIAATGLRDWQSARTAWTKFGLNLPPGNPKEEIRLKIGITPVRLCEHPEVVWTQRIDPARAIIENVPTENGKRRYRDIILHDGAPNGFRQYNNNQYPVFDELELFEASDYQSFSVWVRVEKEAFLTKLEQECEKQDFGFENWTNMIRYICKQCSEGKPHEIHDHNMPKPIEKGLYNLGIAAKTQSDLQKVLTSWQKITNAEVVDMERII